MKPNGDYEHDAGLLKTGCGLLIMVVILIAIAVLGLISFG